MIELTRLNGTPMLLNSDLIKTAEASPDTMLTLINGEKLIVREGLSDVLDRVLAYRAVLLATVARKLSPVDTLRRASALTSLEFASELGDPDSCPDPIDSCIEQQHEDKGL
ncbi:flagellar FlbD family protein [Telmatobacter sp. DSM 110680]|uniref:Flagellar FlbD family protein n=1 Tax=Telmatobacter sp. DSM 110680 TaxID=3036704 RepID=A0AAU7DGM5_9BACT